MGLTVTSSKPTTNLVVKGKSQKKNFSTVSRKKTLTVKNSLPRTCHFESVEISCKTVMCLASGSIPLLAATHSAQASIRKQLAQAPLDSQPERLL